jgi:hypothetical protein
MSTDERATQLGRRHREPDRAPDPAPASTDGDADEPAAGTRAGRRRAAEQAAPEPPAAGTSAGNRVAPAAEERDMGSRANPAGQDEVLRFGPGVPASSPAWAAAAPARRRRPRRWVGALLTLVIVVGVVLVLLLRGGDPIAVQGVGVRALPAEAGCDTTVDVVGTITTNGRSGTVRYQWFRSDGQSTEVLAQSVASGATSADVHLQWSVSGQGRLDATATLRVLEPAGAGEGSGSFTYRCS